MSKPWLKFYDDDVPDELVIPQITIPDLLRRSAEKYPKQTATIFLGARMNYADLKDQVDRLAAALHELGVRKGDRVAIMLPNCPQTIIAYYATLSLGAVSVMTNPLYVERELEYQWGDSGTETAVALDIFWPRLEKVMQKLPIKQVILTGVQDYMPLIKRTLAPIELRRRGKWVAVDYDDEMIHPFKKLIGRQRGRPPEVELHPEDLACLQYTGGTTGLPKGAMLSHQNLIASTTQIRTFLLSEHQEAEDIALAVMPFFHVYGMNGLMNMAMLLAATLVLIPEPDIKQIVDAFAERPTFFAGVPALFVALNNYRSIDQVDLTSIKAMFSGAAPLPVDVMETFEARTSCRIAEAYGMTEASSVTHTNPMKGQRKFGSIGLPIIGVGAKIVDPQDPSKELGVDEVGELVLKGPQVMQGYWNAAEETENAFHDGWLRTGDLARMDEEGYFYIVDRKKDIIISAGYNVYPREVEEVLYQHPKVQEAAVIGLPDTVRGEKITAYITLKDGETATAAEIRAFCRERLAQYKQPRSVVFRDDLPMSLAGKVLRRELREEALAALEKKT